MTSGHVEHRRAVAAAAHAVLDGRGTYEAFLSVVADEDHDDPQLEELIDAINHLPPRSRLYGRAPGAREAHLARLQQLADAAEAD